jgi:hypothetical protein
MAKTLHIQKHWDQYRATLNADKLPAELLDELREAFYAGAISMLGVTIGSKNAEQLADELKSEVEWHMRRLNGKAEQHAAINRYKQ